MSLCSLGIRCGRNEKPQKFNEFKQYSENLENSDYLSPLEVFIRDHCNEKTDFKDLTDVMWKRINKLIPRDVTVQLDGTLQSPLFAHFVNICKLKGSLSETQASDFNSFEQLIDYTIRIEKSPSMLRHHMTSILTLVIQKYPEAHNDEQLVINSIQEFLQEPSDDIDELEDESNAKK